MVNSFGFEVLLYMMYYLGPVAMCLQHNVARTNTLHFLIFTQSPQILTEKKFNTYLRDIGINGKKKVKFDPSHQGRLWVLTLSGQES